MIWRIFKYFQHLFYIRHRKGHGIHSPYLFEFVHEVVFNASQREVPAGIRETHRKLRNDREPLPAVTADPGAGSKVNQSEKRSVGFFVRKASVSRKYGALLYRITNWFRPDVILELGTGLGISTLYLAAGSDQVPVHSIEGNPERANFAGEFIKRCGPDGVKVHHGALGEVMEQLLPDISGRFVAFVDADHRFGPTIENVRKIMERAGDEAVLIMDDIYWSKEMNKAWKEVISWSGVRVSIDLFQMGILLLRKDLHKASLKINF